MANLTRSCVLMSAVCGCNFLKLFVSDQGWPDGEVTEVVRVVMRSTAEEELGGLVVLLGGLLGNSLYCGLVEVWFEEEGVWLIIVSSRTSRYLLLMDRGELC